MPQADPADLVPLIAKTCMRCKRDLPLSSFDRQQWGDGYLNHCKRCTLLWNRFRMTALDYDKMYQEQNGVCWICKNPETSQSSMSSSIKSLAVDHDKVTGKVRGLLCSRCNIGIGQLQHSVKLLQSAIEYLELTQ